MPSALIIGAGPNIGRSLAAKFAKEGYKVAIASRSTPSDNTYEHFRFDAAEPATVPDLFAQVSAKVGTPKVVIYNVAARSPSPQADPLDVDLESYTRDMNANAGSLFMAAREAVRGFDKLGAGGAGGTFIFTGNKLNVIDLPGVLVFGVGKAAAARLVQTASRAYREKGYKFYYADQRAPDGNPVYLARDGEAHAEHYIELVKDEKQRPWLQTFVEGKGYVDFAEKHGL